MTFWRGSDSADLVSTSLNPNVYLARRQHRSPYQLCLKATPISGPCFPNLLISERPTVYSWVQKPGFEPYVKRQGIHSRQCMIAFPLSLGRTLGLSRGTLSQVLASTSTPSQLMMTGTGNSAWTCQRYFSSQYLKSRVRTLQKQRCDNTQQQARQNNSNIRPRVDGIAINASSLPPLTLTQRRTLMLK